MKNRNDGIFGSILRDSDFQDDTFLFDRNTIGNENSGTERFLNRFSLSDMKAILDQTGLYTHLAAKGFPSVSTEIFTDSDKIHHLCVYDGPAKKTNTIIDLRLSEGRFVPQGSNVPYDMYFIEWLQSQNPRSGKFSSERPQLPGQKRPGLGCLKYLTAMMNIVSCELSRDGFLDVPDHFHLAVIYSGSFMFFNPEDEGRMRAVLRDCREYTLSDIAWGIATKSIIDIKKEKPYEYKPSEEIFPISDRMKKYFNSREYRQICSKTMKQISYRIDFTKLQNERKNIISKHDITDV